MSESKSKIISFRLAAEIELSAQKAAIKAGEKNASAWCRKLVINALSKSSDPPQSDSSESTSQLTDTNDLIRAFANLRQLNLDCFELLLKNETSHREFLRVAIQSEDNWGKVSEGINKSLTNELTLSNQLSNTNNKTQVSEPSAVEEILKNKFNPEKGSGEFLLLVEELENEIAEFVAAEPEVMIDRKVRKDKLTEPATNQMASRLTFFEVAEQ